VGLWGSPLEGMGVTVANPQPAFWRGKRVLVTGHTGFKGGWLTLWLAHLGADVKGVGLPPTTQPNLFEAAKIEGYCHHTVADIRDRRALADCFTEARPEIVFHLAAQPLVRESYLHPVETYATNVMGTVHVLEAARQVGTVKAIVIVTTDKCYENREWVWGYREDEPMGGYDPYSSSKGCSELVTSAYRRSFMREAGIALASARAGNVIGGGDWATDRLIPDILRAIAKGEPVRIRYPHAIRPWQHVLEPLSGYLALAERLREDGQEVAEAWNFSPVEEDARPVHWIADYLTQAWGDGASWVQDGGEHPHEAQYLKLDSSKSRARLGWRPRWSLPVALDRIVAWHRASLEGADLATTCLAQIEDYSADRRLSSY
jgi:CDP-glucose 4,6-dehydratase